MYTHCSLLFIVVCGCTFQVVVAGYDVRSSMSEAFQVMGYCPQHDPLWDYITLREHLECYAKIQGVNKQDVQTVTNQ